MLESCDRIEVRLTGRARAIEFSPAVATEAQETETIRVSPDADVLAFAVVDQDDNLMESGAPIQVRLRDPSGRLLEAVDNQDRLVIAGEQGTILAVINNPAGGNWSLEVSNPEGVSFRVSTFQSSPTWGAGRSGAGLDRCGICKAGVRALAVAIVFARGKAVLPAAVIVAVAKFLGSTIGLAESFLKGLAGLAVQGMAERLCQKVSLCPKVTPPGRAPRGRG